MGEDSCPHTRLLNFPFKVKDAADFRGDGKSGGSSALVLGSPRRSPLKAPPCRKPDLLARLLGSGSIPESTRQARAPGREIPNLLRSDRPSGLGHS